jgi:hypothetical protein
MEVQQTNSTANTPPPTASTDNVQKEAEIAVDVQRKREQVEEVTEASSDSQLGTNIDVYA